VTEITQALGQLGPPMRRPLIRLRTVMVMGATRPVRASSEGTRRSMQANKGRDTKPELALRRAVHALGLRYRVSARPLPGIRRTADLVFTRVRVAIFLDGCFWHGCPVHHTKAAANAEYWAEKVARNRQRDAETDRLLSEAGWLVIRVWEHEDSVDAAVRVAEQVRSRRS
jgi:DNA mismatch endonuclease (patch repair protein)